MSNNMDIEEVFNKAAKNNNLVIFTKGEYCFDFNSKFLSNENIKNYIKKGFDLLLFDHVTPEGKKMGITIPSGILREWPKNVRTSY